MSVRHCPANETTSLIDRDSEPTWPTCVSQATCQTSTAERPLMAGQKNTLLLWETTILQTGSPTQR